jgi:DNA polymerase III subunit delta
MSQDPPVVYLLHGEDEFAITQFIAGIQAKLGDPALVDLNTTRLDGRSITYSQLEAAVSSLPFMGKRRVVLLSNPLAYLNSPPESDRFKALISRIPAAVAFVLYEFRPFTTKKDKKFLWLEKLAEGSEGRVYLKAFPLPKSGEMPSRIQRLAKETGGEITPKAAQLLASLVGDNSRIAQQELSKLFAYVNYHRAVEEEDVLNLTADIGQGDIFEMVDAIGNRNGRLALQMLHRLLLEQDVSLIYGMVVRQFRLLLLSQEILENGGQQGDVIRELKLHPYVGEKVVRQGQHFSMPDLEAIYHRLLEMDVAVKSGEVDPILALDTLIAGITA